MKTTRSEEAIESSLCESPPGLAFAARIRVPPEHHGQVESITQATIPARKFHPSEHGGREKGMVGEGGGAHAADPPTYESSCLTASAEESARHKVGFDSAATSHRQENSQSYASPESGGTPPTNGG